MERGGIDLRTAELARQQQSENHGRTDRLFSRLLVVEWIAGVAVALWIAPRTWSGLDSRVHPHVWAAILLGALIVLPAAFVARALPGRIPTRHAVAIAQMAMGSLLIHLTGGRIETHFYIFGSLAFLFLYKDWQVLVTATIIVAGDHLLRGWLVPESVYGVANAPIWRSFEHAFWVVFEDAVLIYACVLGQRDVRHIAERHALLENRHAVEAASEAKSQFLANMSHEIRTPMTAVQGYADLLLDPALTSSDRLNYVQVIRRNSEHLLNIINDILDLSKIEANKMEIEAIACSPCSVVVDVASLMRVRAVEKRLGFDVRYLTPVPEVITSDPTRLRQVLMNLVGNAIKFTKRGQVSLLVRCDPTGPEPRLTFEVADTGLGISKEGIRKIFQPFTQADSSTTRKFGGTGLGLTICQRLASLLGGRITVESLEGRGSSFTLAIATGALTGVRMIDGLEEAEMPTPAFVLPQIVHLDGKVLLAEDGYDNQVLISTHLRKAGATVEIAENGRIAVDMATAAFDAGAPFDVILMDMQLPELDGYGATARLRSRGYARPIIALTAHAMAGDRDRCIQAGCDDYLSKPVQRPVLIDTVRRYMSKVSGHGASAPAHSATPQSIFHQVAAEELASELAGDEDMAEILASFVGELPARVSKLRASLDGGDRDALRRLAHQLKGAAGGYGFPRITEAAGKVEAAIDASPDNTLDITALRPLVDALASLCSRATAGNRKAAA